MKSSRRLGQLLVDRRLLTRDVLEAQLGREKETGKPLASVLIDEGYVREEDLLRVVAEQLRLPFVELDQAFIEPEALASLEPQLCRELHVVPVKRKGEELVVAVADPFDWARRERLEKETGLTVTLALATKAAIADALEAHYGLSIDVDPPVLRQPGMIDQGGGGAGEPTAATSVHLNDLLAVLVDAGGSDLHITAGTPPQMRVNGRLQAIEGFEMLRPADLRRIIYEILTEKQRNRLEDALELDCSHPLPGRGRFRVNVFFQRDAIGAVLRAIPNEVPSLDELRMPAAVKRLAELQRGLVLVTGATGAGKSTTLAAIIDLINTTRGCHILTIEDPIEFLHRHKRSIVNQREVGVDTQSFAYALRHALRQDPDVILVGEMRDLETISTALSAAETGHLVLATLHTQSAPQSIDRIVDAFPAHQQEQVRVQLAATLQGIVSQQLVPNRAGDRRVPAVELLIATPAVRNVIRESKVHQLTSIMQSSGKHDMQTMDQSLAALVRGGVILPAVAHERAHNPEEFKRLIERVA